MNDIIKRFSTKKRFRWLAWLLIVVTMVTGINPVPVTLAAKEHNWNVDWLIEVSGEAVESEGNFATVFVEEQQEVNLALEIVEGERNSNSRFKETFNIELSESLYDMITEDGAMAIDWDKMTNGVLEAVDTDVATGSNSSKASGTNADRATGSNYKNGYHMITLQFQEELRNEETPEETELDIVSAGLSFTVTEDLILTAVQEDNNIRFTAIADTTVKPLSQSDSSWKMVYSLEISRKGGGKDTIYPGQQVHIQKGDVVQLVYDISMSAKWNAETAYEETFEIVVPETIVALLGQNGNEFAWAESSENTSDRKLFTEEAPIGSPSDNPTSYTYKLQFNEFFREHKVTITAAGGYLKFEATEETILDYIKKEDSDSVELKYKPKEYNPKWSIGKTVIGALNKNKNGTYSAVEISSPYVQTGDYVLYKMQVNATSCKPGEIYRIDKHEIIDCFDGVMYQFVDYTDSKSLLAANAAMPDSMKYPSAGFIAGETSELDIWEKLDPSLIDSTTYKEINKIAYPEAYANKTEIDLAAKSDGSLPTVTLYAWLKLRNITEIENSDAEKEKHWQTVTDNPDENQDALKNRLFAQGKTAGKGPVGIPYYDSSLYIRTTDVYRGSRTDGANRNNHVVHHDATYNGTYNKLPAVLPGDFVTYKITLDGRQGSALAKVSEVKVYVPQGLKLITAQADLPENFCYYTPDKYYSNSTAISVSEEKSHSFPDEIRIPLNGNDYRGLYQVKEYTLREGTHYSMNQLTEVRNIYFTCEVLDISSLLTDAGFAADDKYAQALSYMLTAEISGMTDADGNTAVDDDSYFDDNPFNDWYNFKDGKIKNAGLFYGTADVGERDNRVSGHVREFKAGVKDQLNGQQDEDDFDYALLTLLDPDNVDPGSVLSKHTLDSTEYLMAREWLGGQIDGGEVVADISQLMETTLEIGTIVPYRVDINSTGAATMSGVEFQDTIPSNMHFLKDNDGEPVVLIAERVESNGIRYPNDDGIGIIRPSRCNYYYVKEIGAAYRTPSLEINEQLYEPGAVAANNHQWPVTLTDAEKTLNIEFGDIENNAYTLIYFVVVDQFSYTYRNQAKVSSTEITESTDCEVNYSMGAYSRANYKKIWNHTTGTWESTLLDKKDGVTAGNEVKYLIHLNFTITNNGKSFPANTIGIIDEIQSLGLGADNIESVTVNAYPSDVVYKPEYDPVSSQLKIVNSKDITSDTNIDVEFTVKYREIPAGIEIVNVLDKSTTRVRTPLLLDITKTDAVNHAKALEGAVFALTYDKPAAGQKGTEPVRDADGAEVTLTTDGNGQKSAEFYLDAAQAESAGANAWKLYLQEIQAPDGYYLLGQKDGTETPLIIELIVEKDEDNRYQVIPDHSAGDFYTVGADDKTNAIVVTARDYSDLAIPATAEIGAVKHYNRTLEEGQFSFHAELIAATDPQGTPLTGGSSLRFAAASNMAAGGTVTFPKITFDQAGTYIYAVTEVNDGQAGIQYDNTTRYAVVTVTESQKRLTAEVKYYNHYQDISAKAEADSLIFTNHFQLPEHRINIRKESKSTGAALSGAKFQLTYRMKDSQEEWKLLSDALVTGADGTVSLKLPQDFEWCEYKLVETESPSGYSKTRVGTITFTVTADGRIADMRSSGTSGYAEVSGDRITIIVRNHKISSGGSSSGGGSGGNNSISNPSVPAGTIDLGEGQHVITEIDENGVPLTDIPDEQVPLSGLAKTGDAGMPVWLLVLIAAAAAGGFAIIYRKRRNTQEME